MTRALGFVSTIILVRVLVPEDFGLVSLAVSFFQALDQIAGFGVEGAIIRAERADRIVLDAGFTINVVRGLFTALVLAAAAHPVARFFANEHLVQVIYALAFGWAVSAFQNIGVVEFRRDLAFDKEFKLQLIPRVASFLVTIVAAFLMHSYWALVIGLITIRVVSVVVSYTMHPYRPWFGVTGMRFIFSFSFWEWIIGMVNMLQHRADTFIIARVLGTASVGIYGVGTEIALLPMSEIISPLCRALFSGFVAERREGNNGAQTMFRVFSALALLTFPLSMGLSLVAYPVVKLAFGEPWLGAVPVIQVLGFAATISLFSSVGETLFSAHAWLRSLLWMTAASAMLRIALLVTMIMRYGLLGAVLAGAVMAVLVEAVYLVIAQRRLGISIVALLLGVTRPAVAVAFMAAVLNLAGMGWNVWHGTSFEIGLRLIAAIALGAAVYTGSLLGLWFLAGKPAGAETDALTMLRRMAGRR